MNKWIKRLLIALGVIGVMLAIGAGTIYAISENQLNTVYNIPADKLQLKIPTDQAAIERGKRLVTGINQCNDCHGANMGGKVFADIPGMLKVVSANVTSGKGGIGSTYTDADWVRTLRHGVKPDGRPVVIMPSQLYANMSDEDLGAVIAYVKTLPAVDNVPEKAWYSVIARGLLINGTLPPLAAQTIDHNVTSVPAIPAKPDAQYGKYLANIGGCVDCHGPTYSGGPMPLAEPNQPIAANLTPAGLGFWTEADFIKAMRNGQRPDGKILSTTMPWPYIGQLSDDELKALFAYLKTLAPKATGGH